MRHLSIRLLTILCGLGFFNSGCEVSVRSEAMTSNAQFVVTRVDKPPVSTQRDTILLEWTASSETEPIKTVDLQLSLDGTTWVTVATQIPNTGSANWTPPAALNGDYQARMVATLQDGPLVAPMENIEIDNQPPTLAANQTAAGTEDVDASVTVSAATDDHAVVYELVSVVPADASVTGCLDGTSARSCTIRGAADYNGDVVITYKAKDVLQNEDASQTRTITVSLAAVNDAPRFDFGGSSSVSGSEEGVLTAGFTLMDPEQSMSCASVTITPPAPLHVSDFAITGTAPNCSISFTGPQDLTGSFDVLLQASDGAITGSQHVIFNLANVNDAPEVPDQDLQLLGTPAYITAADISFNDPDVGDIHSLQLIDASGNPLTSASSPGEWSLVEDGVDANGNTRYRFDALVRTADEVHFRMSDGEGGFTDFAVNLVFDNPIMKYKPALAVGDPNCVMCHASVKGNVLSNFNNIGRLDMGEWGVGGGATGDHLFKASSMNEWRGRSGASMSMIKGTYYAQRVVLDADVQTTVSSWISESKTAVIGNRTWPILTPAAPASVNTFAKYLNLSFQYRDPSEVAHLMTDYVYAPAVEHDVTVKELSMIKIAALTDGDIRPKLKGQPLYYYKRKMNLSGIGLGSNGLYYTNTGVVNCDGDLFLDKPLFLENPVIKTIQGCRIYGTRSVFMQGTGGSGSELVTYQEGDPGNSTPNLQISSVKNIVLGLGRCSFDQAGPPIIPAADGTVGSRLGLTGDAHDDYDKIVDGGGVHRAVDAGDCQAPTTPAGANRNVSSTHLFLNAARIDSRLTGTFTGAMIAPFVLGSLGAFSYVYDPTFSSIPILPMIRGDKIFDLTDCASPVSVDTKFVSCVGP